MGKLLRDYSDGNCCLIFGPDSPTTKPYNPSTTPYVVDIVIIRELHFPVDLSSSAISSDHLPVLIDTRCCPSFHSPPDRPDVRHTDWANFQAHLEAKIPLKPELLNMDIDTVRNFSGAIFEALAASTTKRRPHGAPPPKSRLVFRMKYA